MNRYRVIYQVEGELKPESYETEPLPFFKEAVQDAYNTLIAMPNPGKITLLSVELIQP